MLLRWMVTGEIFNRVKAVNRPVRADAEIVERLQNDFEARSDLAQDTIAAALPLFREQLKTGRWDPEKGTLTTYFIGTVVLSFSNAYRAWARRLDDEVRVLPLGVTPEELSPIDVPRTEDNVSVFVESSEAVSSFFRMLKSPDREVAQMVYEGKTVNEVADRFGVSPRAIRQRLRRLGSKAAAAGLR
ncbi:sigma-70 family RNA polymerase sigma factor [Streptomyces sp. NPDC059757]|uniref:sigma-70 family RNA polymerase sigma factor n=1 Tax=Streptomyces sp. NPDC059757 TaxID=3346935 RepID=UPI00365EF45D